MGKIIHVKIEICAVQGQLAQFRCLGVPLSEGGEFSLLDE